MKSKLFLIYFIGLFFIDPVVYAEVAPGYTHTEKITCGTSGQLCGPQQDSCPQNTYCGQAECIQCAEEPWLLSAPASFGRDSCYQECGIKQIENGKWEPDYNIACHGNYCTYKNEDYIVCDNETSVCDGYHAENGTCVSNRQECEEIYNGVKIGSGEKHWFNNSWLDECYVTECETGYHLSPKEEGIGDNKDWGFIYCSEPEVPYGTCESDTEDACKKWLNCDGGTVGGEAKWIRADSLPEDADWVTSEWEDSLGYAGGYWDFSGCYCDKKDSVSECGVGIKQCKWESSGPWGENAEWSENCTMHGFTECKAGCCDIDNSGICNAAPAGYFGDGTMMACQPCPIGATSAVGAMGIDRCFMQTGNTEFCDSVGCFKLPSNVPY